MSNYRRLISYIYAYEGGIKGKNIGFAKIEARNGQCKIQVSVKKVYVGNNDMGVYLLAGNDQILLGKIFIRNGAGEFRAVVPVGNVENSGWSMDQCYGLSIHSVEDSWQAYTTIWDDAVIQAAELQPGEPVELDTVDRTAQLELGEVTAENLEVESMARIPETSISEETVNQMEKDHKSSIVEEIEAEIQAQSEADEQEAREIQEAQELRRAQEVQQMQRAQSIQNMRKRQRMQEPPIGRQTQSAQQRPNGRQAQSVQQWPNGQQAQSAQQWPNGRQAQSVQQWPNGQQVQGAQQWPNGQQAQSAQQWPNGQQEQNMQKSQNGQQPQNMQQPQNEQQPQNMQLPQNAQQLQNMKPSQNEQQWQNMQQPQGTQQQGSKAAEIPTTEIPQLMTTDQILRPNVETSQQMQPEAGANQVAVPEQKLSQPEQSQQQGQSQQPGQPQQQGQPEQSQQQVQPRQPEQSQQQGQPQQPEQPQQQGQPQQQVQPQQPGQSRQQVQQPGQSQQQPQSQSQPQPQNIQRSQGTQQQMEPPSQSPSESQEHSPSEPSANLVPPGVESWELFNRLEMEEQEPGQSDRLWQHFRKTYPKIQAFDYVNGCEILMIKPQDIGLLPREIWTYGNNSFLLHGYYSFRYLILVKLNNPQGPPRYLLGVPGHYYSNEKYMASMFGFPNFVLSKLQPSGDVRFGYWYTDINMGNQ